MKLCTYIDFSGKEIYYLRIGLKLSQRQLADFLNCSVTSSPSLFTALPSLSSTGGLGVGSPPSLSGQKVKYSLSFKNPISSGSRLVPPSYLHLSPSRHALTATFISQLSSALFRTSSTWALHSALVSNRCAS